MDKPTKEIAFFEKYLSVWVLACIAGGILLGKIGNDWIAPIASWEIYNVNVPIAVLIWLMIFPMMVQIDFSSVKQAGKKPKGLMLTLSINWVIKPLSMALFAYVFFTHLYAAWIEPGMAPEYIAGAILLGAAPCTAMVFVWSYLTNGDPNYTLVQVSVNDLMILAVFVPIVAFLFHLTGVDKAIAVPYNTLITSVAVFVVIPLAAGVWVNRVLVKKMGEERFKNEFLPSLKPVSISALLATLVLLFAFQGNVILDNPLLIVLIAVPLSIQTYFIFFVTWGLGKWLKLPHNVCAPAAMIGTSNFFELAVAVAVALFGLQSPAALVTVVGVLTEVPIMLSLVALANRWHY